MIENYNESKQPSTGEFIDIKKYIGVASVKVLAINPSNDKLRKYGWPIKENAPEPEYVKEGVADNGTPYKFTRVRFLIQIQDLENKPVTYLDFTCRKEPMTTKDRGKWKIIDKYGRTAWATTEEVKAHKVPVYKDGKPANISQTYYACHRGEEEIVAFLFKLLNITPLTFYDRTKNAWTPTTNPGSLHIDSWDAICDGNVKELAEYVALKPDNCVKVVLGVQTTPENKTYQAFLNTGYIGNGASVDMNTGEYTSARNLIDKYTATHENSNYSFSAEPVKEWSITATEVSDNSSVEADVSDLDDLPWS